MGRFSYISWHRLKSDTEHLFVKMSGKDYLEEQPETLEDAVAFAHESLEATQEIRDIQKNENRTLVIKLDLRDCDMSQVNWITYLRYGSIAANQNLFIDRIEVWGSGALVWFGYIKMALPRYIRDKIKLIETDE